MKAGNHTYRQAGDLPAVIPVFPLAGALLLPHSEMPLNIFEPRYVAMIDSALADARIIGMVQPDVGLPPCARGPGLFRVGCAGRLTSFAETGDGRYMITLTGVARFRIVEELSPPTPFRQCRVTAEPFLADLADGEHDESVNRPAVLDTLRAYLTAHKLTADWASVERASNETLINTLAMMAPFDTVEKQALLEAPDLKARAETLVTLTEMTLAREAAGGTDGGRLQ
jgi:Lon protease-like protein